MVRKVVIPAAGLGTRLLPITKELPKEMLPVFFKGKGGRVCLKPMLQAVFEQLYDAGFREFCFIVGRGKRAIEDHFTPDWDFIEYLRERREARLADELENFYGKIATSTIVFANQPQPKGFGDAVLQARAFTGDEPFLVHAGDDLILSEDYGHIARLIEAFQSFTADAVFLAERVKKPERYGVIVGEPLTAGVYRVRRVVEKPKHPSSDLAIIAVYIFKPSIYAKIEGLEPDEGGEIQLTNAVQRLIDEGYKIYALELEYEEKRVDIGTPISYKKTLATTYARLFC